jgi:hypothetical protein
VIVAGVDVCAFVYEQRDHFQYRRRTKPRHIEQGPQTVSGLPGIDVRAAV